eukprot:10935777-Alexandrium_andersonii.AAC.1
MSASLVGSEMCIRDRTAESPAGDPPEPVLMMTMERSMATVVHTGVAKLRQLNRATTRTARPSDT